MNLGKLNMGMTRGKKIVRWVIVGFFLLFIGGAFVTSYFKSKTAAPTTPQPAVSDDEGFRKLYQDLTKDRPQTTQQKQALAEAVSPKRQTEPPNEESVDDWVARGGWKNTPVYCDSLRVQYAMLAFAFGKLVEENEALKQQVATSSAKTTVAKTASPAGPRRSGSTSGSVASGSGSGFDFTQYFNRGGGSTELTSNGSAVGTSSYSDASFVWATLSLPQKQQVRNESVVTLNVDKPFTLGGVAVPYGSTVTGTAQVSQGVGRVYVYLNRVDTPTQTITVDGEVYSLDRSRGINVFVHSESALAEGLKREASDWVGLLDPTRSGLSRNVLQDTDVGREFYANLDAGTMVLAKIRPGR
jgi:hypothetical protein